MARRSLWFLETKTISPEQALLSGVYITCLYLVRKVHISVLHELRGAHHVHRLIGIASSFYDIPMRC